jgi:hypothetical protein
MIAWISNVVIVTVIGSWLIGSCVSIGYGSSQYINGESPKWWVWIVIGLGSLMIMLASFITYLQGA